MAIREDLVIDWNASPRIIEVTSAADNISIQDFYDTLRSLAAKSEAIDNLEIVDAGGKEGGIVAVTMTLFNALIKFKDTGTPRTCKVSGGNLFAVDENGEDMFPIAYNNNVTVGYAQSISATLLETGISGLTEEESARLMEIQTVKAKTDNLPADPASQSEIEEQLAPKALEATSQAIKSKTASLPSDPASMLELAAAHGAESWEGATPTQLWEHTDRKITSRNVDSEAIASEEQIEALTALITELLAKRASFRT